MSVCHDTFSQVFSVLTRNRTGTEDSSEKHGLFSPGSDRDSAEGASDPFLLTNGQPEPFSSMTLMGRKQQENLLKKYLMTAHWDGNNLRNKRNIGSSRL